MGLPFINRSFNNLSPLYCSFINRHDYRIGYFDYYIFGFYIDCYTDYCNFSCCCTFYSRLIACRITMKW